MRRSPSNRGFAVPFDIGLGEISGRPISLRGGIAVSPQRRDFSVSRTGTLFAVEGSALPTGDGGLLTDLRIVHKSGAVETVELPEAARGGPRFSPDGRRIAYTQRTGSGGSSDVWTLDLATEDTEQLTFEGTNLDPRWSPDGARLLFASDREGSDGLDLFVKPADNSGAVTSLLSRPGDQIPQAWLADGSILFTSDSDDEGGLYTLDSVGAGDPVRYDEARRRLLCWVEPLFRPTELWSPSCPLGWEIPTCGFASFPTPGDGTESRRVRASIPNGRPTATHSTTGPVVRRSWTR